jgi:serine phosphatase RsbU (regulator of sigma subunit)
VPRLADLCVIDLIDGDGLIRDVAVVGSDAQIAVGLEALRREHPIDPGGNHPVARVLRSGTAELLSQMTTDQLRSFAESDAHARFMIGHHYHSAVVAPLRARDRTLGTLSVLRLGGGDSYSDEEFELTCELARRAALAIDNARLFADLSRVEQRLEAILSSVAEAITVIDATGQTVYANQAAADLLQVDDPSELTNVKPGTTMARFRVLDEHGEELDLSRMPARRLFRGEAVGPLLVRNIVRATGEERWLNVRTTAVDDPVTGELRYAVNVFENITEMKRAEVATSFLADCSRILASSLDYEQTLADVASLAVPRIADWCAVDIVGADGQVRRVAIEHQDAARRELGRRLSHAYPIDVEDSTGVAEVIRTGRSIVVSDVPATEIDAYARDADHLALLREIDPAALIIVPMTSGAQSVGAITLLWSQTPRRLARSDLSLAEELGRRTGAAVENARLFAERTRIAEVLQRALLPASLPEIPGADIEARYAASGELNEVGGDFYDVFAYDASSWILAIGDVCGKGPRAASVTALARHTLRAAAMSGSLPTRMLELLHEALLRDPGGDMCTVCLVLVTPRETHADLSIALAGHLPPLIVAPDGDTRAAGELGTLLGLIEAVTISSHQARLQPGETLLLYTDGVPEAGDAAARLGEDGLRRLAREAAGLSPARMLEHIERGAIEHAAGHPQDDIALLALRMRARH